MRRRFYSGARFPPAYPIYFTFISNVLPTSNPQVLNSLR